MNIKEIRDKIDATDEKIIDLLNRRYRLAMQIGELKKKDSRQFFVPEREKQVLCRLEKINSGPMKTESLRAIYREIMSGARALEKDLKIGFFGLEASYTNLAALAKFGHSAKYVAKMAISDVFNDVEAGRIDYGVVPIENSTEGAVNHTLDMFINSTVKICAEINMRIHHNLLACCGKDEIKRIYSHSQVLAQCRGWLQQNFGHAQVIEAASSTEAARKAKTEKGAAAIGSSLASELYGLKILADNIEDVPDNTTRFMVIGKQDPAPTGDDKTSICFAVKDRVGALYDSLLPFKQEAVTLTMIESRPSRRKNWEYYFFVDYLGHSTDEKTSRAIEKLSKLCQFIRILGSYPRSNEIF